MPVPEPLLNDSLLAANRVSSRRVENNPASSQRQPAASKALASAPSAAANAFSFVISARHGGPGKKWKLILPRAKEGANNSCSHLI